MLKIKVLPYSKYNLKGFEAKISYDNIKNEMSVGGGGHSK